MSSEPKFTIEKGHFLDLLTKVMSVVPTRDAPVLKNIKFDLTDKIKLSATDLEQSLVLSSVSVEVERVGSMLIPAKKLFEIVKESTSERIVIDVEDVSVNISIGDTSWSLQMKQRVSSFPKLPVIDEIELHRVSRLELLRAIDSVKGAVCQDLARPHLRLLKCIPGSLASPGKILASDGTRFQQAMFNCPIPIQLPSISIGNVCGLLKSIQTETVEMGHTDNHIVFRFGSTVLMVNKMIVEFPDLEKSILAPALTNNSIVTLDRKTLISLVRQSRINANPETSALMLDFGVDLLNVVAKDKFGNFCNASMTIDWLHKPRVLTVNHKHLSEALNMLISSDVVLYIGTDTKTHKAPLMLKDEEFGVLGVIQQMRLG